MINYKQALTDINTEYVFSTEAKTLERALGELDALLTAPNLSAANRANAEALRIRIVCKIYALEYLECLDAAVVGKLVEYADVASKEAAEKGYNKSAKLLDDTVALLKQLSRTLGVKDEISALSRSNGVMAAGGGSVVAQAKKLTDDVTAEYIPSPFGDNVAFPDIRERLASVLTSWQKDVCDGYARALEQSVPHKKLDLSRYDYFPVPEYDEGGKANVIILNTPFADEARLYASHALPNGTELCEFVADEACDGKDGTSRVFAFAEHKNCAVFVSRAEMLSDDNKKELLGCAMRFGRSGGKVFILDPDGGELYDIAMSVAAADGELSALDVSAEYITMPSFDAVRDELIAIGWTTADEGLSDALRQMPFLGFSGLNEITLPQYKRNWAERGKKISAGNAAAAKRYLAKLRSPILFIDGGWGDFKVGGSVSDDPVEFDYDDIDELDIANIRTIVNSNSTVFGMCGMVARYCTTGTADLTEWAKLEREEMENRVRSAVMLVLRVLRVPVRPVVEILDELENKTAGGTCYDGGKRIVFKYEYCKDLQWLRGAIVHECFHALQAKLARGNWSQWYYDNMGITFGRAALWKETRDRKYNENTNSDIYRVHMYEADARAFEVDCARGAEYYWNGLDLT